MTLRWLILIWSILFGTSLLYAKQAKIGVEFRTDLVQETSDDPEKKLLGEESKLLFRVARARVNIRGDLSKQLSYRVRVRFNRSFDSENDDRIDRTGEALQLWYVEHEFDKLKWRVGKIRVLSGSIETITYSSIDTYYGSRIKSKIGSSEVGTQLSYTIAKQKFQIQVVNSPAHRGTQTDLSYNIAWTGKIGGILFPVVTFGSFPSSRWVDTDKEGDTTYYLEHEAYQETHWGAGTQFKLTTVNNQKILVDGEYNNWEKSEYREEDYDEDDEKVVTRTNFSEKIVNTITGVRYITKLFTSFLRYSIDEIYEDNVKYKEVEGISTGIEYTPLSKLKIYRFHLVYVTQITNTVDTTITENQINTGLTVRF